MSMELRNYLVSWVVTYLGDLQPTYIGVIIYLLSTMDILVAVMVWFPGLSKLNDNPWSFGESILVPLLQWTRMSGQWSEGNSPRFRHDLPLEYFCLAKNGHPWEKEYWSTPISPSTNKQVSAKKHVSPKCSG